MHCAPRVCLWQVTDVLDVSSLETTYKIHEEFRQAMKTCHLEDKEDTKKEKPETSRVSAPTESSIRTFCKMNWPGKTLCEVMYAQNEAT
jgi:hypothetical protein